MNKKLLLLAFIISTLASANEMDYDGVKEVKLETTIVTGATGFEVEKENTASPVVVISKEEIEKNNYASFVDAIKNVPAVNIIGDPKKPIIDMRGFGNESSGDSHSAATQNVQLLVDGVATNFLDTNNSESPVNFIPVENIERIEIIPGGGAIVYGGGTAGGVINIVTKKGANINGGYVSSDIDSFGAKQYSAGYGVIIGKLGVNIGYTGRDYQGYRDGDTLESDYIETGINYQINDAQKISFKYSRMDQDTTSPNSLSKEVAEKNPTDDGIDLSLGEELSTYNTVRDDFVLNYKYELADKLTLDITGYHTITDLFISNKLSSSMIGMTYLNESIMNFEDKKYGIKPKLNYKYNENGNLIVGYDFIKHNFLRKSTNEFLPTGVFSGKEMYINDYELMTNAIFALNTYKIGKFQITEGIRYEHSKYDILRGNGKVVAGYYTSITAYDRTESNLAYELSANYLYSDTGNIYLKGIHGFTSPMPQQMYDKEMGAYIPNDLDSEKYDTIELGIKDIVFGSYLNGTIYYTEVTDDIEQNTVNYSNFEFFNIGKTRRVGFELSAEQYFGNLTIREGYAYTNAKVIDAGEANKDYEGKYLTLVPRNRFSLSLDYQVTSQFNVILSSIYSEDYYVDLENENDRQNGRVVTNITLNYEPLEDLKIYGGINNIFNERYYDSVSSDLSGYDPAAERNIYLGFKYTF